MTSLEAEQLETETTARGRRRKSRTRPTRRPASGRRGSRRRGRRSTTLSPPPAPAWSDRPEDLVQVVPRETLRLPCHASESDRMNCLNDGQCFVVVMIQGIRNPGCRCSTEWTGKQCERRNFDYDFSRSSASDTYAVGIAFGIVFGFIALFAAVVGAATYCWFRKQLNDDKNRDRTSVVSRAPEQETSDDVTNQPTRPGSIGHVTLNNNTTHEAAGRDDRERDQHQKNSVKSANIGWAQRPCSVEVDCHDETTAAPYLHERHFGISYTPADSDASQLDACCNDDITPATATAARLMEPANCLQQEPPHHERCFANSYTAEPLH